MKGARGRPVDLSCAGEAAQISTCTPTKVSAQTKVPAKVPTTTTGSQHAGNQCATETKKMLGEGFSIPLTRNYIPNATHENTQHESRHERQNDTKH
jgi:hypothetical protein